MLRNISAVDYIQSEFSATE